MNISSQLITIDPARSASVLQALSSLSGLEIHHVVAGEKVVAVLERETTGEEVRAISEMYAIDGVLSVVMAAHFFEEEADNAMDRGEITGHPPSVSG